MDIKVISTWKTHCNEIISKFWRNQLGQHFQVLWKHFNSHVFNSGIRVRAFELGLSLLGETILLSANAQFSPHKRFQTWRKPDPRPPSRTWRSLQWTASDGSGQTWQAWRVTQAAVILPWCWGRGDVDHREGVFSSVHWLWPWPEQLHDPSQQTWGAKLSAVSKTFWFSVSVRNVWTFWSFVGVHEFLFLLHSFLVQSSCWSLSRLKGLAEY